MTTDNVNPDDLQDGELVAAAQRLGARAADRLDLDQTARRVVDRWRVEQARVRPFYARPAFLRIAAALILVAAGVATWRARTGRPDVVAVVPSDAGLEGLSADQLQALLPAAEEPAVGENLASDAGLEGLSPDELRSILASMGS